MKNLWASAALVFAVAVAAPAQAGVIPNTGATLGPTDPSWSVMWRPLDASASSSGALANAFLIPAVAGVWQPNVPGVNNWIGATASSSLPDPGATQRSYEYAFTTHIEVLGSQTVTGAIGFDNFFVGGFINGGFDTDPGTYTGTQFVSPTSLLGPGKEDKFGFCRTSDGFLPSGSHPTCTVNFAFNLPAGEYDITFVIQGDGTTDGFILNQQGVTVVPQLVPEPGVLALMAFGFLALGWRSLLTPLRIRRKR